MVVDTTRLDLFLLLLWMRIVGSGIEEKMPHELEKLAMISGHQVLFFLSWSERC